MCFDYAEISGLELYLVVECQPLVRSYIHHVVDVSVSFRGYGHYLKCGNACLVFGRGELASKSMCIWWCGFQRLVHVLLPRTLYTSIGTSRVVDVIAVM